ncbi:MAG TPA: hypothetical protein VL098_08430 [Flavipsychrobacter sp.]|nr:hypothetical protein [Flavipsychrobacter sp.]
MKKNIYYRSVLSRRNILQEAIMAFFLGIASFPRLILEVFYRRNMGERYFTLASAITVALILFFLPRLSPSTAFMDTGTLILNNKLWYLFLAAFCYFSFLRYREVKRNPSVFDLASYTKKDGELLPIFWKTKFDIRQLEIYIEPLPALVLGFLLLLVQQYMLGLLFTVCALIYSISKAAQYMQGDHFVMDKIDERLCNEDLRDTFLHNKKPKYGFKFRHEIPEDLGMRADLYDSFFEGEDDADSAPLAA